MENTQFATRPITAADQAVLWQAIYYSIYVPPGAEPLEPDVVTDPLIARYVEDWGAPDDLGVLAFRSGAAEPSAQRAVGAAWLRLLACERKGFGHVDDQTPELAIAVWPDYRAAGIGSRLLAELLRRADERFEAASLSVSKGNPAVRLYRRFGFETVVDDGKSLVMRRKRHPQSTT